MTIDKFQALPPGSSTGYNKVDAGQNACKGGIVKEEGSGLGAGDPHTANVNRYKQGR